MTHTLDSKTAALWRFDEAQNNSHGYASAASLSGNYNATQSASAMRPLVQGGPEPDGTQYARHFFGDDAGLVVAGTDAALRSAFLADYTVEFWIYAEEQPNSGRIMSIGAVGGNNSSANNYLFLLYLTQARKLLVFWERGSGADVEVTTAAEVPLRAWTHVAITVSSGTITLFINGAFAETHVLLPATGGSNAVLAFGTDGTPGETPFNGLLTDVRLSTVVRSAEEVLQSASMFRHINDASTFDVWRFDEPPEALDSGPHGFHLAPVDFSWPPTIVTALVAGGGHARFGGGSGTAGLVARSRELLRAVFAGEWTFEFWGQNADNAGTLSTIIFEYVGVGSALGVNSQAAVWTEATTGKLVVSWKKADSFVIGKSTGKLWDTGVQSRHHIAVVKSDAGGGTFDVDYYRDGIHMEKILSGEAGPVGGDDPSVRLSVFQPVSGSGVVHGRFDDMRLSHVARTPTEIQASYQLGVGEVITAQQLGVSWEESIKSGRGDMVTYLHTGIVIDKAEDSPNAAGLRVEVWDEAGLVPDLVAHAVTDADGRFELHLSEQDVEDLFGDEPAIGFFKIWTPSTPTTGRLLADTQGKQTWDVRGATRRTRVVVNSTVLDNPLLLERFVVRGHVTHVDDGPYDGLQVDVYDMRASGDVLLGTTSTTARGFYELEYDHATLVDKQLADLKVSVVVGTETFSVTRCQAPPTATLHLTVDGASYVPAEYGAVLSAIAPALGGATLESLTDEQIEQVACSAGRSPAEVRAASTAAALVVAAAGYATPVTLDATVVYALIRQGLPDSERGLLATPRDVLRSALERAQSTRTTSLMTPEATDAALDVLRDAAVSFARQPVTGDATCSFEDLLVLAGLSPSSPDEVAAFLHAYSGHEGNIEEFWELFPADPALTSDVGGATNVANAQRVFQLGALTAYHFPLITWLWGEKGTSWNELRDLGRHDESDWLTIVGALSPGPSRPTGIPSDALYAALLIRAFQSALPTDAIAGRTKEESANSDLDKFFTQFPEFDFEQHRVEAFLADNTPTGVADPNQLKADLAAHGRLFRLTKRHSDITVLRAAGLDSSRAITRYGRQRFTEAFATSLGGEAAAARIYQQAVAQSAAAMHVMAMFHPVINGPQFAHTASYEFSNPPAPIVADWPTLFGSLSNCACEHCSSVFSPAAYLVDLLSWLGRFDAASPHDTARDALFARRPDLADTLLDCKNTHTPVPYIDLVNEMLERRVTQSDYAKPLATTVTADEALAAPEYLDVAAYGDAHLAGAVYPFGLPYSLWHQQARVFLEHLGTPRHALMEVLQRPFRPTQVAGCKLWLRADVGLSAKDGALAEWRDLSGYDHAALPAAGGATVGITGRGRPFIEMGESASLVIAHRASLSSSGPVTLVAVVSHVGGDPGQLVVKGANFGVGLSGGLVEAIYDGSTVAAPMWPAATGDQPSVAIVQLAAGGTVFRVDGLEDAGGGGAITPGTDPLHVFAGLSGRLYELAIFDAALTASEVARLEAYVSERYHGADPVTEPTALQIAQERLGMTELEREITTGAATGNAVSELWGFAAVDPWTSADDLLPVTAFLERSGLAFDELTELLDTTLVSRFAAPGAPIQIVPHATLPEPDPCNLEHLVISGLDPARLSDAWDAVQRLLRVTRRTGWTIRETDTFVTALGGEVDAALLVCLGDVAAILEMMPRASRMELASWWGSLDTQPSLDKPSYYASLFSSRALTVPTPSAFTLPLSGAAALATHRDHVLAATRMTAADLALITDAPTVRRALRLEPMVPHPDVTLAHLSQVHRMGSFARATRSRVADLLVLNALSDESPLTTRVGFSFAATAPDADGLLALPSWLAISCATSGRTVQIGPNSVRVGFGAHAARGRSLDGVTWRLAVEKATNNLVTEQTLSAWTLSNLSAATATNPAGTSSAVELADASGSVGTATLALTPGGLAVHHTLSAWHFVADAPTTTSTLQYDDGGDEPLISLAALDESWTSSSVTTTSSGIADGNLVITPFVTGADQGSVRWWGLQLEQGRYPTSFIDGAREGDVLAIVTPHAMAPGGYMSVDLVVAPHYAHDEVDGHHQWLYFGTPLRVFYDASQAKIVLAVGAMWLSSTPLTFNRDQPITVEVRHQPEGLSLTVRGATSGNGTWTAAPEAPLDLSGITTTYVFGAGGDAEQSADLVRLEFFAEHKATPADTRRFLRTLEELREYSITVPQAHYLVRHVSRTPEDALAASALAHAQLAQLDDALSALAAKTAYRHADDPDGARLRERLSEVLASAEPARLQQDVVFDVDTVMSIVDGTTALAPDAQRRALELILAPHVSDIADVVTALVFEPYALSSCQLWFEPSGIQVESSTDRVTGWLNRGSGSSIALIEPDDLTGCVAWLRADQGVTVDTGVSAWAAQIGGHTPQQTNTDKQPVWREHDPDFGGQASIAFDGIDDCLVDAAALFTASTSLTLAVVLRSNTADTSERFLVDAETGRLGLAWSGNSASEHYVRHDGGSTSFGGSAPDADSTQHLIVTFAAGTARLFEHGTDRGTIAYTSADLDPGDAFAVGSSFGGIADFFEGRIAEIIVYDRVLGDHERAQLQAYFSARYTPPGPQLAPDGPFGLAGVRLDGIDDFLPLDVGYSETSHTLVAIVRQRSKGTTNGMALFDAEAGRLVGAARAAGTAEALGFLEDATWVEHAPAIPGDQILTWVFDDVALMFRKGELLGGSAAYNGVDMGGAVGLGGRVGAGPETFDGTIACMGLFDVALDDTTLRHVHDYLLTLAKQPPAARFEAVGTRLATAESIRDARHLVTQQLASAYRVAPEVAAHLLDSALHGVVPTEPSRSLLDELSTHTPGALSSHDRLAGLIRFGKAATVAAWFDLDLPLLKWLTGEHRDPSWLDLDDLPTAVDGIELFDASTTARIDGGFDLPSWLTITCATEGRTAQSGPTRVQTGLGADVARAQARDGSTWVLLVEPQRTNLIEEQRLEVWDNSAGLVLASAATPSGKTAIVAVTDNDETASPSLLLSGFSVSTAAISSLSAWLRVEDPAGVASVFMDDGFTGLTLSEASSTSEWRRYHVSGQFTQPSANPQLTPRPEPTDQGSARFWGMQLELGGYPTSIVGVEGGPIVRDADVLAIDPSVLTALRDGFFRVSVRYAPLYASTEGTAHHDILYLDVDNRLYFDVTARTFILRVSGTNVITSAAVDFERHQVLQVHAAVNADGAELSISGATSGNGTSVSAASLAPISWPAAAYVLGDAAGAQEGAELHLLRFEAPTAGADLPDAQRRFAGLLRVGRLATLHRRLARRGVDLASLFAATTGPGASDEASFLASFVEQSGYPQDDVAALTGQSGFGLAYPADYRTEVGLTRVIDGLDSVARLGVDAADAQSWLDVDASSETQRAYADAILRAAKAKHEPEAWPAIARPLRDELREAQRDALVSHIVHTEPALADADALYDDLLVDVEQSACGLTSRVVLATSTIQLFVHRILLGGLEPDVTFTKDARDEWEWRKNYRVWEANRKVFLYPENWIEPELRDDQTPLFEQLAAQLRQADVTDEIAEDAYRDYLHGLDEVADLKVVGMVHEKQPGNEKHRKVDQIHVFAQTRGGTPRVLYHRRWIDRSYWTPWERVPIDAASMLYLPTVEHGRLSLHWPQMIPRSTIPPSQVRAQLVTARFDQRNWRAPRTTESAALLSVDPYTNAPFENPGEDMTLAYVPPTSPSAPSAVHIIWDDPDVSNSYSVFRGVFDPGREGLLAEGFGGPHPFFLQQRPIGAKLIQGDYVVDSEPLILPTNAQQVRIMPASTGAAPESTYAVQSERAVRLTATGAEQFVPLDTFFLRVRDRNLFAVLEPLPSEARFLTPMTTSPLSPLPSNKWAKLISASPRAVARIYEPEAVSSEAAASAEESIHAALFHREPGIRFYAFSHRYVSTVRQAIYRHGVDGLRDYYALVTNSNDTPLQEQAEDYFESLEPNPYHVRTPYPLDDFDFSYGGAYATYNWELFFHIPVLLATTLKQTGRYAEARRWLHAVFDPTDGDGTSKRDVWRFKPFRDVVDIIELQEEASSSPVSPLAKWLNKILGGGAEADTSFEAQLEAAADDPFNPHRIARMRPTAYQKYVVRLYIENLLEWGDHLFRQDSIESINEALQLYMLARNLLGKRPVTVSETHRTAKTFAELQPLLDEFSNALVALEGFIVPMPSGSGPPADILSSLETPYFCAPFNENMLKLWDTVDDRLFKIRHCMNIEGVSRQLPLFQPPIDPALLVKAKAAGLDIASVLADLYAPPPLHRYSVLVARALDVAGYVVSLGQTLLSTLEKRDAETLGALRASQEVALLEMVRETRKRQADEAEEALTAVRLSIDTVERRAAHYEALVTGGLSEDEKGALKKGRDAGHTQQFGSSLQLGAQILHMLPDIVATVTGGIQYGPSFFARGLEAIASVYAMEAAKLREDATEMTTMAQYGRRDQDWDLQVRLAEAELAQVNQQVVAAEIRASIAQSELANHERQLEDSRAVQDFLVRRKFTNEQLYLWMREQIAQTYHQAYQLAFDMARRAERAYQFERGETDTQFIQFGHWDGAREGLLAGEKLILDLRRMEAAYLEKDRRTFELTKHISLAKLMPLNLLQLRETGSTTIDIDEALFDLDYPGHYFRRVKSASITLPAITGPHTSVNCTLTLLNSRIRKESGVGGGYPETEPFNDSRFLYNYTTIQSICTSSGVNDAGLFELSFRDERLLPFEGAGAVSQWRIDLPHATNRFDPRSLTDVVLHFQYTARAAGGLLEQAALATALDSQVPRAVRLMSAHDENEAAWAKFQEPNVSGEQVLELRVDDKLPFVPGTGPMRLTEVDLAWDLQIATAPTLSVDVSVTPTGESPVAVTVRDVGVGFAVTPLSPGLDVSEPFTVTVVVDPATIAALAPELVEQYPPSSGSYRLRPSVFKDLLVLLRVERDPPVAP